MKLPISPVKLLSCLALTALLAAQLVFMTVGEGGGWCSPYLGAPHEKGHPATRFSSYGFPLPVLTLSNEGCFEQRATRTTWSLPGLGLDGMLFALVSAPLWFGQLKKKAGSVE
jgi:hypothetical protein